MQSVQQLVSAVCACMCADPATAAAASAHFLALLSILFSLSLRPPDSTVLLLPSFHLSGHATFCSFFSHLAHTMMMWELVLTAAAARGAAAGACCRAALLQVLAAVRRCRRC